jgi:hypothetical protein
VRDNDLFYLFAIVGIHRRVLMVLVSVVVVEVSEDGSGVVAVKVVVVVLEFARSSL